MERHLNLVQNQLGKEEKRVFPRFPFTSLTFKASCSDELTFQVNNISGSGMQIMLKDGKHILQENGSIDGRLHWHGREAMVNGNIVWVSGNKIGLSFSDSKPVEDFLKIENIIAALRPLHLHSLGIEKPANLRFWLKAASALEIFVWTHNDGEYDKIQLLFIDQFVEWQDGKGVQTGTLTHQNDLETPLYSEDELTFQIDGQVDQAKLKVANEIIQSISDDKLPKETREFISLKFSC